MSDVGVPITVAQRRFNGHLQRNITVTATWHALGGSGNIPVHDPAMKSNSWPMPQSSHPFVVETYCFPATQNLHVYSIDASNSWYLPVSQAPHAVSVALATNWPATQVLHTTEATVFCPWYWPLPHSLHALDVSTNPLPATQNLQDADNALFWSWYLPASQVPQLLDVST